MLRFAVCDDEPAMLRELSAQLAEYMAGRAYQVRGFPDGRALLESGCDFDLVFLDIRMRKPDGMETACRLREQGARCLLVFVTVLRECVFDAFAVQAFDYLVKPLDPQRFRRVMDRALGTLGQTRAVAVRRGNGCELIPFGQLVYCEVLGRKLYLHRSDGTTADYYGRLDALGQEVDSRFFRCHRSYLVNLDYVRGYGGGQIRLLPEGEIPVSRLRERELAQALLRRMRERDP